MTTFDAEKIALELIRALRAPLSSLERRDRSLTDQTRRAASSAALNISEGHRREGKDRSHHYRMAAGSAAEVRTALNVATLWGYLSEEKTQPALELADRLLAILWRLTHPKGGGGDSSGATT